jgi:hypothetical protein
LVLSMDRRAAIFVPIDSTCVFQQALAYKSSSYISLRTSLKVGQVKSLWSEIKTTSTVHDVMLLFKSSTLHGRLGVLEVTCFDARMLSFLFFSNFGAFLKVDRRAVIGANNSSI